jgi:hypothetical protein
VNYISSLFQRDPSERVPATKTSTGLAIGIILAGIVANELIVARYVSTAGILDPTTRSSVRWVQAVLFMIGIGLLLRKRTALLVLVVGLAMLNLSVFRERVKTAIETDNMVTEGRLRELAKALPAERHVGYISVDADGGYIGTKRYYLTQYAVAPVVVETGTAPDLIIGNFMESAAYRIPVNLVVVRDFGGGLLLLRKRAE